MHVSKQKLLKRHITSKYNFIEETMYPSSYNKNISMCAKKTSEWVICKDCEYKVFHISDPKFEDHAFKTTHCFLSKSEVFNQYDLVIKPLNVNTIEETMNLEQNEMIDTIDIKMENIEIFDKLSVSGENDDDQKDAWWPKIQNIRGNVTDLSFSSRSSSMIKNVNAIDENNEDGRDNNNNDSTDLSALNEKNSTKDNWKIIWDIIDSNLKLKKNWLSADQLKDLLEKESRTKIILNSAQMFALISLVEINNEKQQWNENYVNSKNENIFVDKERIPDINMNSRKVSAKRHRKILSVNNDIQDISITKPDIRRLARRGGVVYVSGVIYEETLGKDLDTVAEIHNQSKSDPMNPCQFCNRSFALKSKLKTHLKKVHEGITMFEYCQCIFRKYECDLCKGVVKMKFTKKRKLR